MQWILMCGALTVIGLYLVALASQLYSVQRARRVLERVQALKIGDSQEEARAALRSCGLEAFETGFACRLIAAPFGWYSLWTPIAKALGNRWLEFERGLSDIGLRPWVLDVRVTIREKKIREALIDADVPGRYERLGAMCIRQAEHVTTESGPQLLSDAQRRTLIRWWALTPGGESLVVVMTPESTEKESRAGRINPKCFSAFYGCRGLCDLLPGVTAVMDERGEGFGGCVIGVPRAGCEPRNQRPCSGE